MEREDRLCRFYSVFPWFEDPESARGKRYFEVTLGFMEKLLDHPWMKGACARGRLKVLEVCGGAGFGGIALAKLLQEKGVEIDLTITDLREEALNKAAKWAERELGKGIETVLLDAREAHKLDEKFDIVLMYGLSTPHFDPWELVRLFSSVGDALCDGGIFVLDESDRRHRIFLTVGYKWALAEAADERFTVSFHTGYDLYRGTVKRHYLDLHAPDEPVEMETFMWGLAEVAAFVWCFFEEVDLVQLRDVRHFVLGRGPRGRLSPGDLILPKPLNSGKRRG
ncbi:class I SAM-dependent methyltransferase [Candidatus Bipolaricaulota sp. J31]